MQPELLASVNCVVNYSIFQKKNKYQKTAKNPAYQNYE